MASVPNDPFAKPILFGGLALLAAAIFVLVSNLFSTIESNSTVGTIDATMVEKLAQYNLEPIGSVVAVDKSIAPVARTGEAIFNAVCTACHTSGVLDAPKLEKAAWNDRIAKGLQGLVASAINGINQMPARGGDPSLTDEEMLSAVKYMTGKAGFDLSETEGSEATEAAAPEKRTEAAPAAEQKAAPEASTQNAEQKAAPEAPAQTAEQKTAPKAPAQEAPAQAAEQKAAPKAPAQTVEQKTAPKTAEQKTAPAPAQVAEQKAAPEAPAPAQVAEQKTVPTETPVAQTAAAHSDIDGQKVYQSICFSCHDSGVANSPKPGDKAAWEARIATGLPALYQSVLKGKGAMPAKGGNSALSDDDIKAAVNWMVAESQ